MSEERKHTPLDEAPRDNVPDLRRFARALLGPGLAQAADALAHAALDRASLRAKGKSEDREAAFADVVRLNRQRVRQKQGHGPSDAGAQEIERRDHSVSAVIAAMPLDERETILVVALAEFGYEAAARILDIPPSTVVSRLMRARARLDSVRHPPTNRIGHLRVVK
jgi:DNA-directed RNA polymerase specialized sigma24 family protein